MGPGRGGRLGGVGAPGRRYDHLPHRRHVDRRRPRRRAQPARPVPCSDQDQRGGRCRGSDPTVSVWERSVLGHSVNGSPVRAAAAGKGPPGLILGGTHGDEPASTYCVQRLMEHPTMERVLQAVRLTVVDTVNPDGLAAGTRHNARRVDINRNFPTENWVPDEHNPEYAPGPEPVSEPETRILVKLLEDLDPRFVLTLHAPLAVVNYDGPAEDLAKAIAEVNGYPVSGDIGYPTPGSFGTYAGVERAIPTVTLELGPGDGPEEWAISGEAMVAGLLRAASQAGAGD
ncbi:MAG: DUF2817 domain-containing protein [Armatimonadia bacterium]|nr:DUF2817 domain-containing protein [Armatimonadia bacterium]